MFGARSGQWRQPEFGWRQPAESLDGRKEKGPAAQAEFEEELSDQQKEKEFFSSDVLDFHASKNVEETKLPCQRKRKEEFTGLIKVCANALLFLYLIYLTFIFLWRVCQHVEAVFIF